MTENVDVEFGAKTSGVESGGQTVKATITSLQSAVTNLTSSMDRLGTQGQQAFAKHAEGAKKAEGEVGRLEEGLRRVGERMAEYFAIRELTKFVGEMGEAGEKTERMAQKLGMSIPDVQALGAMGTLTGVSMDKMGMAVGRLDLAFAKAKAGSKSAAMALHEVGLDAKGSYTNMELLHAVATKFASMPDGPAKLAVSMQLLGRSGAQLISMFDALGKNWNAFIAIITKYGIRNKDAAEKGAALGEALIESKLAGQGLMGVITQGLAPALEGIIRGFNDFVASMIASYKHGGLVKNILDAIALTLRVAWVVVQQFGDTVKTVFKAIVGDADTSSQHMETMTNIIKGVGIAFVGMGAIVSDIAAVCGAAINALTHAFASLGAQVDDLVHGRFAQVNVDAQKGADGVTKTAKDMLAQITSIGNAAQTKINAIAAGAPMAGSSAKSTGEGPEGTTRDDPAGPGAKAKKAASQMPEWEAQLQKMLELDENYFADSKAAELKFWEEKAQARGVSAADEIAIAHKVYALKKGIATQERADALAAVAANTKLAENEAKTQIELAKAAFEKKKLILDEELKAHQINATQREALAVEAAKEEVKAEEDAENALYKIKMKGLQDDLALHHDDKNAMDKDLAAIRAAEQDHMNKMLVIAAQGDNKILQANNAMIDAMRSKWESIVGPVTSAMGTMVTGLLNRTTSFRDAFIQFGDTMVSNFITWCASMLERWIVKEVMQLAASRTAVTAQSVLQAQQFVVQNTFTTEAALAHATAEAAKTGATVAGVGARVTAEAIGTGMTVHMSLMGALAQIGHNAAVAASAVYKSIAGIPIVGPFLAPVMAAAALAAVIGFGAKLFSAEGGFGEVPSDGAMTRLHAKEMVLPAHIATPLRSALAGGGLQGLSGGGGGDNHVHYSPTIIGQTPDVREMMRTQGDQFLKWLAGQVADRNFGHGVRMAPGG